MVQRHDLLTKLLCTNRLNVPERRTLTDKPTFTELLNIAEEHFKSNHFLPSDIKKWDDAILCKEGFTLEKISSDASKYILHNQGAGPFLDLRVNLSTEYENLNEALYMYLQKEFNFNIDGIPIAHD